MAKTSPQVPSAQSSKSAPKVAIIHDFLREYGGAERVVEALHQLYPQAPLYVAFADPKAMGIHWQRFANWDIRQSWMTKIPGYKRFFSPLRVIASRCFESFDLSGYDVVISSANAYFAKAVRTKPTTVHICYCHTPPRSLYGYSTRTEWQKHPVTNFFGVLINHFCRVVDVKVANRVDIFVANSEEVKRRIAKFYRRDSVVIFPPVDVPTTLERHTTTTQPYYLYVNRLAFAKHPELAVAACTQLGLPLKVVGTGLMLPELQKMAGPTIEFLGAVDDQKLHQLYAGATALIYPVEDEDFGIVPIEAMGYGVPVIAHRSGGPRETIQETNPATGLFFEDLSVAGVVAAVEKFQSLNQPTPTQKGKLVSQKARFFDPAAIHHYALQFRTEAFQAKMQKLVQDQW